MDNKTVQVSIGEAKRDFSHWVNQVHYGGDRVVITSRGKPKVMIVNLTEQEEDGLKLPITSLPQVRMSAFNKLKHDRERLRQATNGELPDPVEVLQNLRDDRSPQLINDLS